MIAKALVAVIVGLMIYIWIWAYQYFSDPADQGMLIIVSILTAAIKSNHKSTTSQ